MLLLDDLLLAPGKAVMAIFEELARKAQDEFLDDGPVKKELQEIYALLESGNLSETDFASREQLLMQRLEQIARAKFPAIASAFGALSAASDSTAADVIDVVPTVPEPAAESVHEGRPPARDFFGFDVPRVELPTLELPPIELPRVEFPPLSTRPVEPPRVEMPPVVVKAVEPPRVETPPVVVNAVEPPRVEVPTVARHPVETRNVEFPPAAVTPVVVAEQSATTPLAPVAAPRLPEPPPARLTPPQVVECTLRGLVMVKMKVSAVTAVAKVPNGWRVTVELVESRAVPDTSDLLGVYEVQLDEAGNILEYERTRMRRRSDLGDRR